jgi:hypothetical protein
MSRVTGPPGTAWPPLRMSYADERESYSRAAAQPLDPAAREQQLASALEERLNTTLGQIRASVTGRQAAAAPSSVVPSEPAPNPAFAGKRIDILA